MPGPSGPIVVGYDGSESAHAAIEAAARLTADRPVAVLAVWESMASVVPASSLAIPASLAGEGARELDEAAEKEALRLADEAAARLRELGREASGAARQSHGNVWTTIADYAENEDAALIVVGSRGHSAVRSALLGGVSHGLVHHASRPVLVAR